jgi:hypothetical protein
MALGHKGYYDEVKRIMRTHCRRSYKEKKKDLLRLEKQATLYK